MIATASSGRPQRRFATGFVPAPPARGHHFGMRRVLLTISEPDSA